MSYCSYFPEQGQAPSPPKASGEGAPLGSPNTPKESPVPPCVECPGAPRRSRRPQAAPIPGHCVRRLFVPISFDSCSHSSPSHNSQGYPALHGIGITGQ